MRGIHSILSAISAGVSLMLVNPVNAGHVLTTTFGGTQLFTRLAAVKVFPSGSFTQQFVLGAPSQVLITVSALCSNSGPASVSTQVQLIVDSRVVYPTSQPGFALCSGGGDTSATDSLATYSFFSSLQLSTGVHSIQMNAGPSVVGQVSRLRNLEITVWQ